MGLTELGSKILNAYSDEHFRIHPDTIAEYLNIEVDDVEYELENLSKEGFIKFIRGQSGGCVVNGLEAKGKIALKDPDRFMNPKSKKSELTPQIIIGSVVNSNGINYNSDSSKATASKEMRASREGIFRYIPKELTDKFYLIFMIPACIIILWELGLKDKIPEFLGKLLAM
jgi:predicted transcriptional regulator